MQTQLDSRVSSSVEYRKPTLSPTAIDHATVCGRRLQFYMDPDIPHGGTNQNLAKGRAWHWMMEQWGRARMWMQGIEAFEGEDPERLMGAQEQDWVDKLYELGVGYFTEMITSDEYVEQKDDLPFDTVVEQLRTMLTVWSHSHDAMWIGSKGTDITFQTVEARMLTELGSEHHQMQGYVDAVVDITVESDPELAHYEGLSERSVETVLVDYKSAGKAWGSDRVYFDKDLNRLIGDPRKIIQASLYAEGWERSVGDVINWVVFDVMTVKGKFQRVWVPVPPERRVPMLERWRQVSEQIAMYREAKADMPANPGHYMCSEKWCPFWDRCPMGAPYDHSGEAREQ